MTLPHISVYINFFKLIHILINDIAAFFLDFIM